MRTIILACAVMNPALGSPGGTAPRAAPAAPRSLARPAGGAIGPHSGPYERWHRLPAGDPGSNRNYEAIRADRAEPRPSGSGPLLAFEDRHASTAAYIDYMRPHCVELARVLKKTGSFYYHCDWHASHYVKVVLDQVFGEHTCRSEARVGMPVPTIAKHEEPQIN